MPCQDGGSSSNTCSVPVLAPGIPRTVSPVCYLSALPVTWGEWEPGFSHMTLQTAFHTILEHSTSREAPVCWPSLLPLPHLHSLLKQDGVWRLGAVGVIFSGPRFPPHFAAASADSCRKAGGWRCQALVPWCGSPLWVLRGLSLFHFSAERAPGLMPFPYSPGPQIHRGLVSPSALWALSVLL